jgi:uncharacterized protein YbjT (DUF2867 family)
VLVVCTPTGQIGRQVLTAILGSGTPVRVLVRDPARLSPQARAAAEVIRGSLTDPGAVAEALAGASDVFWLIPPDARAASVEDHLLGFARPLCEALTSQRLVYVSGLTSRQVRGRQVQGRQVQGRQVRGRQVQGRTAGAAADALIADTGVSCRVLRLPAFMDNILWQVQQIKHQGVFSYPVSGDRELPTCATKDIAAVAAGLLLDGTWTGQDSIPLLGAADLSYNDMARIMSEVLGRPVRYQQVPGESYQAALIEHGMSTAMAQWLTGLLARVDQGLYNAEPRTPESTTPTTFRQWCEEVLKPVVLA